jgi:hypothetical protein
MQRKDINTLRKIVHQVGSIYKTTEKIWKLSSPQLNAVQISTPCFFNIRSINNLPYRTQVHNVTSHSPFVLGVQSAAFHKLA